MIKTLKYIGIWLIESLLAAAGVATIKNGLTGGVDKIKDQHIDDII